MVVMPTIAWTHLVTAGRPVVLPSCSRGARDVGKGMASRVSRKGFARAILVVNTVRQLGFARWRRVKRTIQSC